MTILLDKRRKYIPFLTILIKTTKAFRELNRKIFLIALLARYLLLMPHVPHFQIFLYKTYFYRNVLSLTFGLARFNYLAKLNNFLFFSTKIPYAFLRNFRTRSQITYSTSLDDLDDLNTESLNQKFSSKL